MPQYLSPGVYVEEVPSAVQPIAGVGTSTAGFVGIFRSTASGTPVTGVTVGTGTGSKKHFDLPDFPVVTDAGTFEFRVDGQVMSGRLENSSTKSKVVFDDAPDDNKPIVGDYLVQAAASAVDCALCTNFAEFKKEFGDFSSDPGQNALAHAVYGFFNNGGTRCWVARVTTAGDVTKALEKFAAIDEIALVAVPGATDAPTQTAVLDHCEKVGDRFGILDGQRFDGSQSLTPDAAKGTVRDSNYAALYFPWIQVTDPTAKGGGRTYVAPSGHVAGIYARVDAQRGVHKAPANEVIRGALGVEMRLSKAHQDGLNPDGINVIRAFNGNITVWGARTLGGDANAEWKYLSVRRLFLFLRESIDEGTKWVVFEPNEPGLWAKIRRNVEAFLTTVWSEGALFGATPQEAFYVKCDAELNPPAVRDQGQVITEIGVAVVRPAEFVIFRISQWAGPGS